ncbi:phage tail tape measure protein [Pseudomonas sp. Ld6]|uniref:phage tail tape measure protein n=1 Tax=Pseudomonas sp. Ld6 TaxID=649167 RepID=UPI0038633369
MTQTSRLVLEIDSRDAEQKAADVRVALKAVDSAGKSLRPSLALAGASMKDLGDKATMASPQVSTMRQSLSNLALSAGRLPLPLAAAATAMLAAVKVARDAEAYTNLTNRLKLVTESSQQLAYAQQSVFQVAQDTRQSMESTGQVYQRIAQNAKQLGLNFGEVASISKTVSQAVALSGASAQAADASMVQFGQALASGTLRGDELNSIMEQTPALAQAIARGLGVTIGQLRSMGAEGKLTSEKVVEALQNQRDKVDELANTLSVTRSQAMTAFNNSLTLTAGNLDNATSASNRFASGVLSLSQAMDRFNSGEFLDFFRDDKQTVAGLNSQLSVTMSEMRDLGDLRAKLMKGQAGDTAFYKFKFYDVDALDKEIAGLEAKSRTITALKNRMQKGAADLAAQSPTGDARTDAANPAYEKMLETLKKQAALQGLNTEAAKVRYAIENGELGKLLPAQQKLLLQYAQEKDAKEAAEDATKKATQASEQARNATERAFDTSSEGYARQIELINLTTDKRNQASEATKLAFEIESGKLKGITAQQQQYLKGKADELDALKKIREQNESDAKFSAFMTSQQSQTLTQKNGYDMDLAGLGSGDKLRERLREEMQIRQQYETDLKALGAQRTSGDLSQSEYLQQTEALRQELAKRLVNQQDYYNQVDQAQSNWLQGASSAFSNYADQASDVAGQTRDLFTNAFTGMEDAVVNFVKTGKLSFKDFADGVVSDLIRIQIRQAAAGFLGMAFSAFTGGGAALGAATMTGSSQTISRVGFSDGGFTGAGGKFEPKGVVHGGEFVVKKEVVSQPGAREFLERMNANAKGYADGGYVGIGSPTSRSATTSASMSLPPIEQNFYFQGGADENTAQQLKQAADDGAARGMKGGYEMVLRDLKQNGPAMQMIRGKR